MLGVRQKVLRKEGGINMARVKMYSKKDKRFVNFPIACTASDDECKKCKLKFNCDKAKNKEEEWDLWR